MTDDVRTDEWRDDLQEHIRTAVAIGDEDFAGIVESGVDYLDGETDKAALAAAAEQIAAAELAAHLADQRTWPEVIDSDRLLRAFRDLELAGIVARADFTCCQSCGTAEIGAEVAEGTPVRGYTFCHRQDIEAAADGHGIYLSYGTFTADADGSEAVAVGHEIVAALRAHGLNPEWNGQAAKRILVPMTWRRRRTGGLAAWPGGPAEDAGAAAEGPAAGESPGGDAPLAVTYHDYTRQRGEEQPVPMSAAEAGRLLVELRPRDGNFAVFAGRSGGVVQVAWSTGPRLWLESPDTANRCSRGRHVTPDEAAAMVEALARHDRVDLDLLGEYETVEWT